MQGERALPQTKHDPNRYVFVCHSPLMRQGQPRGSFFRGAGTIWRRLRVTKRTREEEESAPAGGLLFDGGEPRHPRREARGERRGVKLP